MQALFGGFAWKSFMGILADLLIVAATFIAAYHLRFGATPPADAFNIMLTVLPAVMGAKIAVFYLANLHKGIWRHAGTPEIIRLVTASTFASAITFIGMAATFGFERLAPAVFIIDWLLTTGAIGLLRFGFRGLRQYFAAHRQHGPRVLLYGNTPDVLLAVRYMRQPDTPIHRTIVGFLSATQTQIGSHTQGLSILGTLENLEALHRDYSIDEVIVAGSHLDAEERRRIERACISCGLPVRYFSVSLTPPPSGDGPSLSFGDGTSHPETPSIPSEQAD